MSYRCCSSLGTLTILTMAILCGPGAAAQWTGDCAETGCIFGPAIFDCCFPDGSCATVDGSAGCYTGTSASVDTCAGDQDGDGIDDICGCSTLATACCLRDGSCQDPLPPNECEAMGGVSFGGPCGSCDVVSCPLPECIGATGSCFEPNDTPGCDNLYCCDQICRNKPECCEPIVPVPATSTVASGVLIAVLLILGTLAIGIGLRRSGTSLREGKR